MRSCTQINSWTCFGLSLILLSASAVAPFRSTAVRRILLDSLPQGVATRSVVRVRAFSPSGPAPDSPSIVARASGGSDATRPRGRAHGLPPYTTSPVNTPSCHRGDRPVARTHLALRC
jgi:hypothetical protein